jgi:hypothetical protein
VVEGLVAMKERSARAARIQRAAQQNIGEILVHIARHQCAPMIKQLTEPAYLSRMLEAAAEPGSEVLQPVRPIVRARQLPHGAAAAHISASRHCAQWLPLCAAPLWHAASVRLQGRCGV